MRRINSFDLIFIFILVLALAIRLHNFDYPLVNGETHRDYLVGRHITKYQEYPLTGPCCLFNGAFGEIRNSPVYYYLIAAILFIKDDIMFLGVVNILLQIGVMVTVYTISKQLFSPLTALITVTLFSFNWEILRQSLFMWQPHLMHPFILLSYLLLTLAYLRRQFIYLAFSVFLFFFSASIHNSVYAITPTFILLTFLILKHHQKPFKYFISITIIALITIVFVYLPWLAHLRNQPLQLSSVQFSFNFSSTVPTLINTFTLNYLTLGGIIMGVVYLVFLKRGYNKKHLLLIVSLTIIQFLLFASLFKATIWAYYMTPILALFVMLIAEVINSTFEKKKLFNGIKILIIFLLLRNFTANFQTLSFENNPVNLSPEGNLMSIKKATDVMKSHIRDVYSFSLHVYAPDSESPLTADLAFWTKLEKDVGMKFFTIIDYGLGYTLINTKKQIFIICQSHTLSINITDDCLGDFFIKNKDYQIMKNIYHQVPFSIYLAHRL